MEKWGNTLLDFFVFMSILVFAIVSILAIVGIILKQKEFILSPNIQWWIFIIMEGILLDGIFLFHDNMSLFKVFDFDNSVDLIYIWISLIPVSFAGIHIGCKVGYGYRLNAMSHTAYHKLKSFFTESFMLSFLLSVLLSIGQRPQNSGSVAFMNYLMSFFIIMIMNQIVLSQFYLPQKSKTI